MQTQRALLLASLLIIGNGAAVAALTPALAQAQASATGQWQGPFAWPYAVSHAALLPDGRVLVWNDLGAVPQIWNPSNGSFTPAPSAVPLPAGARALLLPDGDVLVAGGRNAGGFGVTTVLRYGEGTWTLQPNLIQARDEPGLTLQADARVIAIAGEQMPGLAADIPEKAVPGSPWIQLQQALLSLPRTPWTFLVQNGDVVVAGPDRTTRRLDPTNSGDWSTVADMLLGSRGAGTAVLVPGVSDRFMILGGRDPATATCEVLDLPTTASWSFTNPMLRARRYHNATLLANGTVLVTGGTLLGDEFVHAVYEAEEFDPTSGNWTFLATMSVPRRRGSAALLLPDARVLVAGGGDGTPGSEVHANAEVFSPPYLFQGPRPAITSAPSSISHRSMFVVSCPEAMDIDAIWFVRAGSTSGGFNADQRALSLGFTAAPGALTVAAPDSAPAAPLGIYMMFVVDDSGVPSVAALLQLTEGLPQVPPPNITSSPALTAQVNVQYVYAAQASGHSPFTWNLLSGPAWIGVNSINGIVTGTPLVSGTANVTLRATNVVGFDDQSWTIQVQPAVGTPQTAIPLGATWKYFKGTANPGSSWATLSFNDASWLSGPSGFGVGDNDDATILSDMVGNYSTVFTRRAVQVFNVPSVTKIALLYEYDDGLAVYLNGTRIHSRNAPSTINYQSQATASHEASNTLIRQDFTASGTLALLLEGNNVLAAVGLNASLNNTDLTLKVEFEITGGTTIAVDTGGEAVDQASGVRVFPNPFCAQTNVALLLPRAGEARLDIYDASGHLVRRILEWLPAGPGTLRWDGNGLSGRRAAPGLYLYRLRAGGLDRHGKLLYLAPARSLSGLP